MQIPRETDLSRYVLMPSRSVLCLVVKLCIVVLTVAGEVMPRVRLGGLGFGGIKSSGMVKCVRNICSRSGEKPINPFSHGVFCVSRLTAVGHMRHPLKADLGKT